MKSAAVSGNEWAIHFVLQIVQVKMKFVQSQIGNFMDEFQEIIDRVLHRATRDIFLEASVA